MTTPRILTLLRLLSTRPQVTAAQMAQALGVSERTAYRYLADLSSAGIPLEATPGPGGGYALRNRGAVDIGPLNASESRSLFFPSGSLPQAEIGLAQTGAIDKLLARLPTRTRELVDQVRTRFYFDPGGWFAGTSPPEWLPLLQTAVWEDGLVEIDYRNLRGEVRRRAVEAWALVAKVNAWYLIGRDPQGGKNDFRTFRLSRIIACRPLDQTFQRDQSFDPGQHWRGSVSRFEQDLPPSQIEVVALVHRDVQWYLPAYLEGRFRPTSSDAAEWGTFELVFPNEETARAQLLPLGSFVQVQSPLGLRNSIVQTARAIVQRYERGSGDFESPLSDPLR